MSPPCSTGLPVVIVSESAAPAELCGLPILSLAVDRAGGVSFGAGRDSPPADALAAFLADASQKAALEAAYAQFDMAPPPIHVGCTESERIALTAAALTREIAAAARREADLRQALVSMRAEAEETRVALTRMRRMAGASLAPQPLVAVVDDEPGGEMTFAGSFDTKIPTRVEVHALAAIALHVAHHRLAPEDRLEILVEGEERGRKLGAWQIPASALPDRPDWLTLDLPVSLASGGQTAAIRVRGLFSPDSELCLSQATSGEAPALRLLVARAPRYALSPYWIWPREEDAPRAEEAPAPRPPASIPAHCWLGARLVGAGALVAAAPGEIRVRLPGGAGCMFIFPHAPLSGAAAVTARLRSVNGDEIVAALSLLPTGLSPAADHAAAEASAQARSPLQSIRSDDAITLALAQAPEIAHLAVSLRNDAPDAADFAIVEILGVWLLREGLDKAPETFVREAAAANARDAAYEDARLDEVFAGETYRHLDMTVEGLSEAGLRWPELKFKLFEENGLPGLEFRRGGGRPEVFAQWPGTEEDAFGPIFKLAGREALARALAEWPGDNDRRLISALALVLPSLVRGFAAAGRIEAGDARAWLERARALRAAAT